jgi:hypothetical protein
MLLTSVVFYPQCAGHRGCRVSDHFHYGQDRQWIGHRRGERFGANVYFRSRAAAAARQARLHLQQLAIVLGLFFAFLSNYLIAHAVRGASATFWLNQPCLAMDVLDGNGAIVRFPAGFACDSRFASLSDRGRERLIEARRIFARIGGDTDALVANVEKTVRGEHRPRLADLVDRKRWLPRSAGLDRNWTGGLSAVCWNQHHLLLRGDSLGGGRCNGTGGASYQPPHRRRQHSGHIPRYWPD